MGLFKIGSGKINVKPKHGQRAKNNQSTLAQTGQPCSKLTQIQHSSVRGGYTPMETQLFSISVHDDV